MKNAEDACTRALRVDRLEGWARTSGPSVRVVMKIDDEVTNRQREATVRRADAAADVVFVMDNADVLVDPVSQMRMAGRQAEQRSEREQKRREQELRMAETQDGREMGRRSRTSYGIICILIHYHVIILYTVYSIYTVYVYSMYND